MFKQADASRFPRLQHLTPWHSRPHDTRLPYPRELSCSGTTTGPDTGARTQHHPQVTSPFSADKHKQSRPTVNDICCPTSRRLISV
ncbi:unnamed protein product [Pieris macdunnoughi]|uniref:Uncharacterized protein n=1 Tax=Pieris macdunnoughi TaxID=345717 RepID=A0A821QUV6_9NEOP|nr:unnamed protein product [Pieris macdunnoughi]